MSVSSFRNFCAPLLTADRRQMGKWFLGVMAGTAVIAAFSFFFESHYRIGLDFQRMKCINATVFLIDIKDTTPVRDKLFAVRSKGAEPVLKDGTRMAKFIRGVPGDRVTITEDQKIFVNDKLVAAGFYHLRRATPEAMKKFVGTRILGEDEYWLMGVLPMSFDSRYYGPVKRDQIEGRTYVLF